MILTIAWILCGILAVLLIIASIVVGGIGKEKDDETD